MNFIPIPLQLFLRDSINPQKLAGQQISTDEFTKWKSFLSSEIANVRLVIQDYAFTHQDKRNKEISGLISQITTLSNMVNRYIGKYSPIWRDHQQAHQIRLHYLFTDSLLDEMLTTIREYFPVESGKARITHFSLPHIKMELRQRQAVLGKYLQDSAVNFDLSDLLLNGLTQFINKKNLTQIEAQFIEDFIALVLRQQQLETQGLAEVMIINDFNLPEFFLYCVNRWENRLSEIPGLHEQREMLLLEKNKLYELIIKNKKQFSSRPGVLYHDLNDFLNERYAFVTQMVKLRRETLRDNEKAGAGIRFQINLPVPQFGLFIRMQIERGILVKENVGDIFTFFATHFYTANTTYISPDSLQKKSTDVEFTTAQKMKGHLIGMLNWLNTNYNLSNYN